MPKFRIIYHGDWGTKQDAETAAINQHGPNCKVMAVRGPNKPRPRIRIINVPRGKSVPLL